MIIKSGNTVLDIFKKDSTNTLKQVVKVLRKINDVFETVYEKSPTIEYEYPTFSIDSDGNLIATYQTENRNLTFSIDEDGNLIATYNGADPNLKIDEDGNLIRTIPDTPTT